MQLLAARSRRRMSRGELSMYVALTYIPGGGLLTGFAMRSDPKGFSVFATSHRHSLIYSTMCTCAHPHVTRHLFILERDTSHMTEMTLAHFCRGRGKVTAPKPAKNREGNLRLACAAFRYSVQWSNCVGGPSVVSPLSLVRGSGQRGCGRAPQSACAWRAGPTAPSLFLSIFPGKLQGNHQIFRALSRV